MKKFFLFVSLVFLGCVSPETGGDDTPAVVEVVDDTLVPPRITFDALVTHGGDAGIGQDAQLRLRFGGPHDEMVMRRASVGETIVFPGFQIENWDASPHIVSDIELPFWWAGSLYDDGFEPVSERNEAERLGHFLSSCWLTHPESGRRVSDVVLIGRDAAAAHFTGIDGSVPEIPARSVLEMTPACVVRGDGPPMGSNEMLPFRIEYRLAYELPREPPWGGRITSTAQSVRTEQTNGLPTPMRWVWMPYRDPGCLPIGVGGPADAPPHVQGQVQAQPAWTLSTEVIHGDTGSGDFLVGGFVTFSVKSACGPIQFNAFRVYFTDTRGVPLPLTSSQVVVAVSSSNGTLRFDHLVTRPQGPFVVDIPDTIIGAKDELTFRIVSVDADLDHGTDDPNMPDSPFLPAGSGRDYLSVDEDGTPAPFRVLVEYAWCDASQTNECWGYGNVYDNPDPVRAEIGLWWSQD